MEYKSLHQLPCHSCGSKKLEAFSGWLTRCQNCGFVASTKLWNIRNYEILKSPKDIEEYKCTNCEGTGRYVLRIFGDEQKECEECSYCKGTGENPEYSNSQLKPCPFCGSNKDLDIRLLDVVEHSIRCAECLCSTPPCSLLNEAIEIWNRRSIK